MIDNPDCPGKYDNMNQACTSDDEGCCGGHCEKVIVIPKLDEEKEAELVYQVTEGHIRAGRGLMDAAIAAAELRQSDCYLNRGYSTFAAFASDMWGFTESYANGLALTGETFGQVYLLNYEAQKAPGIDRLRQVTRLVKSDEDAEDWYHAACDLPANEWAAKKEECKTNKPEGSHEHVEHIKRVSIHCKCGALMDRWTEDIG
jgi:hypothetical protein